MHSVEGNECTMKVYFLSSAFAVAQISTDESSNILVTYLFLFNESSLLLAL